MIENTINRSFDAKVRELKNPKFGQKNVPKSFFKSPNSKTLLILNTKVLIGRIALDPINNGSVTQ